MEPFSCRCVWLGADVLGRARCETAHSLRVFRLIELFWSTWEVTITERQADEGPAFLLAGRQAGFTVSRARSGPVLPFFLVVDLCWSPRVQGKSNLLQCFSVETRRTS